MDQNQSGHRFKIRLHCVLAIILFLHSILFIIYWIAVPDFRLEVDQILSTRIGLDLPYSIIFIGLTVLIFLWSLIRSIKFGFFIKRGDWKSSIKNWLFFVTWLLFLVIFYGSFWLILQGNHSQRGVIVHLLNIIRLFSDALILLIVAILLWRLIKWVQAKFSDKEKKWPVRIAVILALILLIGLWLVPTIFPPNWAYRGALPTKPAIIADGGAAMLAPENTLAAVELAGVHDAFGFETTVRISSDGLPFLMRDETFARTTNIAEVYPARVNDLVSSFDTDEIENLNAGLWFIQTDPYNTIEDGKISQTQLSINQGQRIPTLVEALEFVADQEIIVLLHLIRPPQNHPYYDEFFDIVLSICQESDLNDDIWLELEQDQIRISQTESPQITRVLAVSSKEKPQASDVLSRGYEILHMDTGVRPKTIRELRDEGLGVNVHTINQSWLFSQFWLSGVTSISTTNVQSLSDLEKPFINLPFTSYLLIWGLFGIVLGIWLASSFPFPERKIKPEEERPTPVEPELEAAGQMPAISPEALPVPLEQAEVQEPEEFVSEDTEEDVIPAEPVEPVESIGPSESSESVESVAPIEYPAPLELVDRNGTDETEEALPVTEQLGQVLPIEESTIGEEDVEIKLENDVDLLKEEHLTETIEESEQFGDIEEHEESMESELTQQDETEGREVFESDEDSDVNEKDQV